MISVLCNWRKPQGLSADRRLDSPGRLMTKAGWPEGGDKYMGHPSPPRYCCGLSRAGRRCKAVGLTGWAGGGWWERVQELLRQPQLVTDLWTGVPVMVFPRGHSKSQFEIHRVTGWCCRGRCVCRISSSDMGADLAEHRAHGFCLAGSPAALMWSPCLGGGGQARVSLDLGAGRRPGAAFLCCPRFCTFPW